MKGVAVIAVALLSACTLDITAHEPPPPDWSDSGVWYFSDAGPPDANVFPFPVDAMPPPDAGTSVVSDAAPIVDGQWPDASVPPSDASLNCEGIVSEAVCTVTVGCVALYEGTNCECYPDGTCWCESWTFSECQAE